MTVWARKERNHPRVVAALHCANALLWLLCMYLGVSSPTLSRRTACVELAAEWNDTTVRQWMQDAGVVDAPEHMQGEHVRTLANAAKDLALFVGSQDRWGDVDAAVAERLQLAHPEATQLLARTPRFASLLSAAASVEQCVFPPGLAEPTHDPWRFRALHTLLFDVGVLLLLPRFPRLALLAVRDQWLAAGPRWLQLRVAMAMGDLPWWATALGIALAPRLLLAKWGLRAIAGSAPGLVALLGCWALVGTALEWLAVGNILLLPPHLPVYRYSLLAETLVVDALSLAKALLASCAILAVPRWLWDVVFAAWFASACFATATEVVVFVYAMLGRRPPCFDTAAFLAFLRIRFPAWYLADAQRRGAAAAAAARALARAEEAEAAGRAEGDPLAEEARELLQLMQAMQGRAAWRCLRTWCSRPPRRRRAAARRARAATTSGCSVGTSKSCCGTLAAASVCTPRQRRCTQSVTGDALRAARVVHHASQARGAAADGGAVRPRILRELPAGAVAHLRGTVRRSCTHGRAQRLTRPMPLPSTTT